MTDDVPIAGARDVTAARDRLRGMRDGYYGAVKMAEAFAVVYGDENGALEKLIGRLLDEALTTQKELEGT